MTFVEIHSLLTIPMFVVTFEVFNDVCSLSIDFVDYCDVSIDFCSLSIDFVDYCDVSIDF